MYLICSNPWTNILVAELSFFAFRPCSVCLNLSSISINDVLMPRYWCSLDRPLVYFVLTFIIPWLRLVPLVPRRSFSRTCLTSRSPLRCVALQITPKNLSSPPLIVGSPAFRCCCATDSHCPLSAEQIIITHCLWSAITGNCLKDMQLYVPEAVAVGDTVTLSCQYDLENVSAS